MKHCLVFMKIVSMHALLSFAFFYIEFDSILFVFMTMIEKKTLHYHFLITFVLMRFFLFLEAVFVMLHIILALNSTSFQIIQHLYSLLTLTNFSSNERIVFIHLILTHILKERSFPSLLTL